jgi:small subunit ribosomal protein S16
MVRIRLKKMGRRNRPFYRINAIEKRAPRDGRILENLGWYDPIAKDEDKQIFVKNDRVEHWLSVGAQPSDTVKDILVKVGLYDGGKRKAEHQARFGKKIEREAAARVKAEADAKLAAAAKAKADAEAAAKAAADAKAKAQAEADAAAAKGEGDA